MIQRLWIVLRRTAPCLCRDGAVVAFAFKGQRLGASGDRNEHSPTQHFVTRWAGPTTLHWPAVLDHPLVCDSIAIVRRGFSGFVLESVSAMP